VTVTQANQSPTAAFTSSCTNLNCAFTNQSSDPDGTIANSSWNFGDGQTSTTVSPSHTYAAAGSYTVTLTVTDNQGATNTVQHSVTVSQANQSPTAAFTSSCTNLNCSFTNQSSDPDGTIASSNWNFGDGQTSTTVSPSHTYAAAGTYTVTLTVTDNQGATNAVQHSVTVSAANQSPTAAFTSSCSSLTCTFTNQSSDPDGSISANSWNFGDGQTSTTASPSHTYGAGGTYTVTLTVTDNQGATNSVSHSVTVTAPNQPPVASFTKSCTNLACSFTSTSSDPDGSIASYSWTFGDGGTSTVQNPSHTYGAAGTYTVTLRVTDNQGATNTTSQSVTVTAPNQPPVAAFSSNCSGLGCSFTSTSSDPDGSIASYSWTFGDGGTSTAQNPSHTYAAGGTYTVTLKVTDNQGATNTVSHSVTVTAPNTAPVVNAGPDETVILGILYTLNASFSDPDNGPWTYTINWGDGSSSSGSRSVAGSFSVGHTYTGILTTRTITVTVTDSKGASGSDTKRITLIL
jgi:PKD repeat protein